MTGFLSPNRPNAIFVSKNYVCVLGPWDYSSGRNLIGAGVSFGVEHGPPCVRSFINVTVNLDRRTSLLPDWVNGLVFQTFTQSVEGRLC